ncbi:predicted protein [Sclerotinia sclerotiorum 1980 UF-70]|uniref:Uncharacterized protein n=1 Tax=Sclerotinia sclerotiorum (strain ATCC 18683 / 1980 / Ss-1) TaxID=665079 RepID=A7F546_SCLS1|nr:predicted protein [Sclerotinia sclerotiorum 1980 UF-70]EDN97867.1 predicted protein [Sclerotinia sclerotiorum 1980 UF-70]
MRSSHLALAIASLTALTQALTLDDICTPTYLSANFPAVDFYDGITLDLLTSWDLGSICIYIA